MRGLILYFFAIMFVPFGLLAQYDLNEDIWFDNLEEALLTPERVYNLDLSNQALTAIPEAITRFPKLRALKLSDNRLDSLNACLFELRELRFLELSGNRIKQIDFTRFESQAYSLTELWLRDNRLERIDTSINTLKYLEGLQLGYNNITIIESGVSLPNLRTLKLDGNYLKAVPALVYACPKLHTLSLNDNQLESFRYTASLRKLAELNLGDNPLQSMEFFPVKYQLEVLILDWVAVQEDWLAQLPNTLLTLSLEHCELTSIEPLTHLRRLEELSLMHNELHAVGETLSQLRRLRKVWLIGNSVPLEELELLAEAVELVY
jgi:Leucine-rich repeat (LRR) protein